MEFDREFYKHAILELRQGAEHTDQAHALLRDLGCLEYASVFESGKWQTLHGQSSRLDKMATELEAARCEDCGLLMTEHGKQCDTKDGVTEEATHG